MLYKKQLIFQKLIKNISKYEYHPNYYPTRVEFLRMSGKRKCSDCKLFNKCRDFSIVYHGTYMHLYKFCSRVIDSSSQKNKYTLIKIRKK